MISDYEVNLKINKIFRNYNPIEKYPVKIYKIDPYFYEQYEKYIQIDDNKRKYILLYLKYLKSIFILVNLV